MEVKSLLEATTRMSGRAFDLKPQTKASKQPRSHMNKVYNLSQIRVHAPTYCLCMFLKCFNHIILSQPLPSFEFFHISPFLSLLSFLLHQFRHYFSYFLSFIISLFPVIKQLYHIPSLLILLQNLEHFLLSLSLKLPHARISPPPLFSVSFIVSCIKVCLFYSVTHSFSSLKQFPSFCRFSVLLLFSSLFSLRPSLIHQFSRGVQEQ